MNKTVISSVVGLELLANQLNWTIDNKSIIKNYYKDDSNKEFLKLNPSYAYAFVSLKSHTTSSRQEENGILDLIKAS